MLARREMTVACVAREPSRKHVPDHPATRSMYDEYSLSMDISERLEYVKSALKGDTRRAKLEWKEIGREVNEDEHAGTKDVPEVGVEPVRSSSTQYFFSQSGERVCQTSDSPMQTNVDLRDVAESVFEGLERYNGKLDFGQFETLSNIQVREVICQLTYKLTQRGIYNLCHSMSQMNDKQRMDYAEIICTNLLLPKVANLDGPSVFMFSAIRECTEKIPDEIERFLISPVLNSNLNDVTAINAFLDNIDPQRKAVFLSHFLATVTEMKPWHISILWTLLRTKIDAKATDGLINLFSRNALRFCEDKSYGKLFLFILKTYAPFSSAQRNMLWEMSAINKSLFRRSIQNVLSRMK